MSDKSPKKPPRTPVKDDTGASGEASEEQERLVAENERLREALSRAEARPPPRSVLRGGDWYQRGPLPLEPEHFQVATTPLPPDKPPGEVLALNLRVRRAELGWSQIELAEKSGIVRKQISLLERGLGNPKLDTLQTLAHTFRCQVHELLTPRSRFA
jgi:DNA-binding XRE family transcriptional regulator